MITIDKDGSVKVDVSGSISGSGIATLMTHPGQPASDVFAIAPRGIFDAGDAGVRSTGSVQVVAPVVLNGANITAAGGVSGAPSAVAAPPMSAPAAPAGAAAKTDDVAKSMASNSASAAANALTVDVLGYGNADAAANDADGEDAKNKKK